MVQISGDCELIIDKKTYAGVYRTVPIALVDQIVRCSW